MGGNESREGEARVPNFKRARFRFYRSRCLHVNIHHIFILQDVFDIYNSYARLLRSKLKYWQSLTSFTTKEVKTYQSNCCQMSSKFVNFSNVCQLFFLFGGYNWQCLPNYIQLLIKCCQMSAIIPRI